MYFTLKNQNIRCIIEVWKGRIFMEWKQLQEAAERLRTQLTSIHKFKQQQDAIQRQLRHVNTDTLTGWFSRHHLQDKCSK